MALRGASLPIAPGSPGVAAGRGRGGGKSVHGSLEAEERVGGKQNFSARGQAVRSG